MASQHPIAVQRPGLDGNKTPNLDGKRFRKGVRWGVSIEEVEFGVSAPDFFWMDKM
jgi:hypothetical protein